MTESYHFLGEEIDVAEGDGVRGPVHFRLRGTDYETAELERVWQDHGQPSGLSRPSWRTRRHRNYFEVRTRSGERFRIYLDRGTKKGAPWTWVAERRILGE
jgi:hypothetical protein